MKRLSGSRRLFPLIPWFALALVLVTASGLTFTGCGKGELSIHDSGAFKSAAPEVRGQWETALAAARTNGYLVAYSTLEKLRKQAGLDSAQSNAVEDLSGVVGTRMFNAANNGDAEATKALKEVQNATKRR